MSNHPEPVQAKLQALRKAFLSQLPGRVAEIETKWTALREGWDAGQAAGLAQLLHTLAGTAGTFGLAALRTVAKEWEGELKAALAAAAPPVSRPGGDRMAALKAACGETGGPPPAAPSVGAPPPVLETPARGDGTDHGDAQGGDTVFLVEDDPLLAESLALQVRCYGYRVATFTTLAALEEALLDATPLLIIMDMTFPEGNLAGAEMVTCLQQGRGATIPVVFVSGRSDFEARLGAVRAGGAAYLTKPVDVGKLVAQLDILTEKRPRDPYRILVVDDEPLLAAHHAAILEQAGMAAATVTDPRQVLGRLAEFRPELILMDIYMPACNGMELAGVIRQDESYVDIPIVFLSAEQDLSRQLLAMSRGGDDFLTKPIQPAHLIASVSLRADRHRVLRSFMLFDGLTGLLNHTRTKEQVEIEVARASRSKSPLTFALLDIDHFKSVNDTHGHPVGDQVLKSLSRLLRQRLRVTDVVGRFGGEEFAVILPNTGAEAGAGVLNGLREDFGKIRHLGRDGGFGVTFSCGVAAYAEGQTGADLIAAADALLYQAKRGGRNRVVLAPGG
ncbi:MAG: diguanylate cyclase [Desulfobacteraceae bacterium]|nr:diguanylate cyclase [Desulfobacteraceae bacterium]